jgi:hypothetical protein
MAESFVLMINGVWWWEMGVRFYIFPSPKEEENGHMGTMMAYRMLYETILGVFVSTVLFSLIARFFVSCFCRDYVEHQRNRAKDEPLLSVDMGSNSTELERIV